MRPLSATQMNQIIPLYELELLNASRPSHKAVADAVGCTICQARYHWRRYLRLKEAVAFMVENKPLAARSKMMQHVTPAWGSAHAGERPRTFSSRSAEGSEGCELLPA